MPVRLAYATTILLLILISGALAIREAPLNAKQQERISKGATRAFEGRVISGSDAELGLAKYQISLQGSYYHDHMCGGAILNERWIVTAAHCVYGYNPTYLRVATGTVRWAQPDARYFVEEYWVHCNYNFPAYSNDIALIKLNDSIVFNEVTQPVALPTEPLANGTELLLTGWGSTVLWGDTPDVLQKASLTYVDYPTCQQIMDNDPMNAHCHVCTLTSGGQGACHGDSGGPLTANGKLYGVVNWGYPCAVGYPDSHASIYYYLEWILSMINGPCQSCHCYASNYPSL